MGTSHHLSHLFPATVPAVNFWEGIQNPSFFSIFPTISSAWPAASLQLQLFRRFHGRKYPFLIPEKVMFHFFCGDQAFYIIQLVTSFIRTMLQVGGIYVWIQPTNK